MNNVVLLMCGRNKLSQKAKAREMYISERFIKSIKYAKLLTSDKNIFVLSAKHGVLELETEIEPYDVSIYDMSTTEKKEWAEKVVSQLKIKTNISNNNFVFLTDDFYSEYLWQFFPNIELPLKGLDQSKHLSWFGKMLNSLGENFT